MRYPGNIVTLSDTRPTAGGVPSKCLYCKAAIEGPHNEECVVLHRPIKMRITIDLIVPQVRSWTPDQIENRINLGTYCIDNLMTDIERTIKVRGCLCGVAEVNVMGDVTLEEAVAAGLKPDSEEE